MITDEEVSSNSDTSDSENMDTICNDIEQNNNVPKENVDEYDNNNLNNDVDNIEKDLDNIIEVNTDMEHNTEQQDMEYNTEQQDDNFKADVAQNVRIDCFSINMYYVNNSLLV